MMNVQDIVQKRYSTKSFDASKKFQPKILPKSKLHCATVLPASISNLGIL